MNGSGALLRGPGWGAVLLAALLALAGLGLARLHEPDVEVRPTTLTSPAGERVPALRFTPRAGAAAGTALLAHGVTASKETQYRIGEALARAGFECLAIDLPSHGASRTRLSAEAVNDAFAAGARALAGPRGEGQAPAVDVLVGHSFGGGTGAAALRDGVLTARLFVAIGARPPRIAGTRTLLVGGAQEELAPPEALRAHARAIGAEAAVVPFCDHALEPFHPGVVGATVAAACAEVGRTPPATPPTRWIGRLAGAALLVFAGLLAVGVVLPANPPTRARARGYGLAAGVTVGLACSAALHGPWLFLLPTLGRVLLAVANAGIAWLAAVAATAAVGRGDREDGWREALRGQALLVALVALATVGLAASGLRFSALLGALAGLVGALGIGLAALVGWRTRSAPAAHAAFATLYGYAVGLWFGGFVPL